MTKMTHSSTKNIAEIIHSNSWHTWLLIPNMMMSWITSWAIFSAHFTFQEAFWHHTRRIFCYNTASLSRVLSCSFESGIFYHSDHTTFPPGDRPPGAICAASNNNRVWLINVSIVRRLRFNYFSHKTPALWIISFCVKQPPGAGFPRQRHLRQMQRRDATSLPRPRAGSPLSHLFPLFQPFQFILLQGCGLIFSYQKHHNSWPSRKKIGGKCVLILTSTFCDKIAEIIGPRYTWGPIELYKVIQKLQRGIASDATWWPNLQLREP